MYRDIEVVINKINKDFGIDVRGSNRSIRSVRIRAVVSYILREKGCSTTEIGECLNKDHSSIVVCSNKVYNNLNKYQTLVDRLLPYFKSVLNIN